MVVELQDQGDLAGIVAARGFDRPKRSSVGITTGLQGQLEMVGWIVARCVFGEAPGRSVFKALVYGQNDHFAGTPKGPVI